jgi:hypothetical protein
MLVFGSRGHQRGEGKKGGMRASVPGLIRRCVVAACLGLFVFLPLRVSLVQLRGTVRSLVENRRDGPSRYAPLFKALGERIPEHSVIASDPLTSYLVSAYTDHFVTVTLDQHGSPSDTNAVERLREARNLLSPAVALEASRPWLIRERADYVLLDVRFPANATFFDSVEPAAAAEAYEKFHSCPSLMAETLALGGFHLFRVRREVLEAPPSGTCAAARAAAIPCEGESLHAPRENEDWTRLVVDTGMDVGSGVVLVSLTVDNYTLHPGDTLKGHFCWRASQDIPFGLPLEAVIRVDSDFHEGKLYRRWYGKQYRRIVERWNNCFYRLTWQLRLVSGPAYPDMWAAGGAVKQDFSFALSPWLAPGSYEVRVKVRRVPYLPNRSIADYLENDDSLNGVPIGMIYVQEHVGRLSAGGSPVRPSAETSR